MIKRKERIERWRAERKKKEIEINKKPSDTSSSSAANVKKWSLEDDEEDDVEPVTDPKVIEIEDSPTRVKQEQEADEEPEKKEEVIEIDEQPVAVAETEPVAKESSPEPKPAQAEEVDDVDPLDAFSELFSKKESRLLMLLSFSEGNRQRSSQNQQYVKASYVI